MKKIFLLLVVCFSLYTNAQVKFEKHYGGEVALSADNTNDGGYIIAGSALYAGNYTTYLVKTNFSGDTLWVKKFVGDYVEIPNSVKQTSDGGYIITGTGSNSNNEIILFLRKTDANGNIEWSKNITAPYAEVYGRSVLQTSDGGFIVVGEISSFEASGAYLVKTDNTGNILWTRVYSEYNTRANSVIETSDGGYLLGGVQNAGGPGSAALLIKTDYRGYASWLKTIDGPDVDFGYSVQETDDNNYVLLGYSQDIDVHTAIFMIKTDTAGSTLWTKKYKSAGDEYAFSVNKTSDNGLMIAGSYNNGSLLFFKTDGDGVVSWAKISSNASIGNYAAETPDLGFIVTGAGGGGTVLIKTDQNGNSECNINDHELFDSLAIFPSSTIIMFPPVSDTVFQSDSIIHGIATDAVILTISGGGLATACSNFIPASINGPEIVCPNSGNISFVVHDVDAIAYNWTTLGGITITSGQGTDSITISTDSLFTSGNISVNITVAQGTYTTWKNISTQPLTPGSITEVCAGATTYYYYISAVDGASSYTWSVPAGASITGGQGTTNIIMTTTSAYNGGIVSVYASNSCGTSPSSSLAVTALTVPDKPGPIHGTASICEYETGLIYYTSGSPGATNYEWSVPAGATITDGQGTTSITVNYGSTGEEITVIAKNGCQISTVRSKEIDVHSCNKELLTKITIPEILIYPNPGTGVFKFLMNSIDATETISLKITNVLGEIVYSGQLTGDSENEINLTGNAKGIYLVQLSNSSSNAFKKIVIQ